MENAFNINLIATNSAGSILRCPLKRPRYCEIFSCQIARNETRRRGGWIRSLSFCRGSRYRRRGEFFLVYSGLIIRNRRLVDSTSGIRYPPIIVALSRDLKFNLSIRRSGTWYPIAPNASERSSLSRHFSSNFRESAALLVEWRASLLYEVFPFRLPGAISGAVERSRKKQAGRTVGYFYSNGDERKGRGSCYFVNEASDASADDVHEQVVIDRPE